MKLPGRITNDYMRNRFTILLYILLAILYASPAYSMAKFFFSHLGVEDGLSQLSVMNIYQDTDGYLWFGTRNGANRYDGYEFRIYQNEVNNPESLSDNHVRCIAEDKDKNTYIGTGNGLNRIDHATLQITRFYPQTIDGTCSTNSVNSLLLRQDGVLYAFCGNSVFRCYPDKAPVRVESFAIADSSLTTVVQAADGNLFIGTIHTGIYVYSPDWKLLHHFKSDDTDNTQTLPFGLIYTLLPDKEERLWIGTEREGLCLFDRKTGTFRRLNKANSGISNNSIRALAELNDSTLLIGTFGGLNMLNKRTLTITPVSMDIAGKGNLSHYSIHSMLIDKDQTLWVGTYSAGINYHSPSYTPVSYITLDKFAGIIGKGQEGEDENIWFATEGAGLLCYNPKNGKQQLYPIKPPHEKNYEANIIKSILIQGDSILCSTHFGSVYQFSIRSKQYTKLHDFKDNDIYSLYIDSKKRLWIPTNSEHGLVMAAGGKTTNSFASNGSTRSFTGITLINEIEPGCFIFGSITDSIYLYDMNKQVTTNISSMLCPAYSHSRLGYTTAILQDKENSIWIATTKNGLYRLDRQLRLIKHYQKKDGLSQSHISSLTLDKSQNLWATTGKVLYKLNRKTDQFTEFDSADFPALEFTLYSGNCISEDGTIYFSGNKGILSFNPEKIIANPNIPPVYITSLICNNQEDITAQVANQSVTLKADQSNIAIRYTALNFIHAKKNQYAYQLEGADAGWHTVGNRREAYYSNLPPGTYTFRVKASNNDGIWNPQEAVLYITVDPPFYRTWWAYLLYISILTICIIRIIRHQQIRQEQKQEARYKQMEQEKTNELQEERMRMFTNFSHELRTPLTLIINPLNDLLQHVSFSPEVKSLLQLIKKNTGRMLLLVNNLMDIQKYEAGKTILQKTRFNFSAFIREMRQSFESVAGNREITFVLHNQLPDTYYVCLDEAEIEKVFFNLLSNAFKFTPPGGCVTIHASSLSQQECENLPLYPSQHSSILIEGKYLFIEVTDTGKGLSDKEAEKIFEPFYRSEKDIHQQISGTGIGLSLTRSIVMQHNGCIWTHCSEQQGTRFMLLLPDTEKQEKIQILHDTLLQAPTEINRKVNLLVEETEARNKQTILLADDNQEVLQYLEQQLRNDFIVKTAINGKEALAQIEQHYPHILISDVMMPEMNGLELCKRIKENQNYCHIPVILLTAKSMVSQIEEGLNAEADDYIVKPFHISLLKARIRNILSLREKMRTMYGDTLLLKHLGVEEPQEDNDFLTQYIEIVKANISNQELDVSFIYQALGMSRANFYRKVKAVTGLSPIELIKNIRLEAGAKLLKESNMNISEIAQHIGFSSRSYFARSFKAVYGMSPTEYQDTKTIPIFTLFTNQKDEETTI